MNLGLEEDLLLFCRLPGFGGSWLQLIGMGCDIVGVILLSADLIAVSQAAMRGKEADNALVIELNEVREKMARDIGSANRQLASNAKALLGPGPHAALKEYKTELGTIRLVEDIAKHFDHRLRQTDAMIEEIRKAIATRESFRREEATTTGRRTFWALAIILLGFALQIIGAWPCS
ncbi:hypothetical protein [Oricola sp.]|uniref:hypothetical protein n=1 Tax=Oricola sp. TaxID=1979950 RepID=UPI0025E46614|nr:hypothetical protein [Oricola sp.]MCI5076812.1 hypothetical protein [Oricola sp.]